MGKRSLVFIGFLRVFVLAMSPPQSVQAGMQRLSNFQEGIFALSQKNYVVTSETDKTDQYIDDEQAQQIAALSDVKPYTPADEDYPLVHYSLVDSLLLSSDLVIYYGDYSKCFFCAKTRFAYLSRNDISVTSFTAALVPPTILSVPIRTIEPIHHQMVTAVATTVTNYYLHKDFVRTYSGIMKNADVITIHGCWTVFVHQNAPFQEADTRKNKPVNYELFKPRYESTLRTGHYSVEYRDTIDPGNPQYGNTDKASLYGPYSVPGPPIIVNVKTLGTP